MPDNTIRVLVADDDVQILADYESLLPGQPDTASSARLRSLGSDLFDEPAADEQAPSIETTCCQQGEEAVRLAEQAIADGAPFDVIILDILMPPGCSGLEAAHRIRAADANVPIIFITGFTSTPKSEIVRQLPPPERLNYFTKPVQFSELRTTIHSAVGY